MGWLLMESFVLEKAGRDDQEMAIFYEQQFSVLKISVCVFH